MAWSIKMISLLCLKAILRKNNIQVTMSSYTECVFSYRRSTFNMYFLWLWLLFIVCSAKHLSVWICKPVRSLDKFDYKFPQKDRMQMSSIESIGFSCRLAAFLGLTASTTPPAKFSFLTDLFIYICYK